MEGVAADAHHADLGSGHVILGFKAVGFGASDGGSKVEFGDVGCFGLALGP